MTLRRERAPLLVLIVFIGLVGAWAGLIRLGWHWPTGASWPGFHGALMVSGFLGTLIGLERAVALDQRWVYSGPIISGLSALWLLLGFPPEPGKIGLWVGSGLILLLFGLLLQRQAILPVWVMAAGSLMWFIGNGLWLLGYPIPVIVLWWVGFLALTIVGERIELARILTLRKHIMQSLYVTMAVYALGPVVALFSYDLGVRISGLGLLVMALWLLQYDIARRTIKLGGLPRFAAVCLLTGYVWMAIGGVMALIWGGVMAGPHYDAWLHAFFIGFVFSMIFGHAPIIFPTVLGLPIEYREWFYSYLVLLHISLIIRIVGDVMSWWSWRRWGGLLNGIAILAFLIATAAVIVQVRLSGQRQ
ncbi:MAG: hypothetical protein GXO55_00430 [Chloroflexi bacterium]|nr:hypothetical protein [Chloroflexota bacterium]